MDANDAFSQWLAQAAVRQEALSPDQLGLLRAAFRFRQLQGDDYYSTRLLSHFLLHCHCGLKVAQLARLLHLSRSTASQQQHCSSKQAVQQAHHRLDGRPFGKLLPRYAGPIAQFLLCHPEATRADVLDFIDQTWSVRVSRIALYHFLKKYGLQDVAAVTVVSAAAASPAVPVSATARPAQPVILLPPPLGSPSASLGRNASNAATPPFSADTPSTREPFC